MSKTKIVSYLVSDAIDNGVADLVGLRDELQEWYDNLPESFQNGSKGDALNEAIEALNEAENFTACDALTESADADDPATAGYVGGLRFDFHASTKKRMSRADRCSEACSLLSQAIECVMDAVEVARSEDVNPYEETQDEIASSVDELQNVVDNAEGASFPGMYG